MGYHVTKKWEKWRIGGNLGAKFDRWDPLSASPWAKLGVPSMGTGKMESGRGKIGRLRGRGAPLKAAYLGEGMGFFPFPG